MGPKLPVFYIAIMHYPFVHKDAPNGTRPFLNETHIFGKDGHATFHGMMKSTDWAEPPLAVIRVDLENQTSTDVTRDVALILGQMSEDFDNYRTYAFQLWFEAQGVPYSTKGAE